LQEAGFAVHSIRQTLIPGAEAGTIRDGYGEGAFVGINVVNTSIELLEQINKAYDDQSDSESLVFSMRSKHHAMVKDQWE